MADYFYPSNLLVSEPLQCFIGGREPSQALHLSSSLCLWCEAVAGECVCVCVPEPMALPAHSRCSLHVQPHKLVAASSSKQRAAGVLSCDSVTVAAGISGLFKAWQRVGAVHKENLILPSAGSCMELLGTMRIYAANVVPCVSLLDCRNKAQSSDVACLSSPRASSATCTALSALETIVTLKVLGILAKTQLFDAQYFRQICIFL